MKRILLILILSFSLIGCLEFNILVKVNPDGSGTIEETVLINKALIEQMKEMAESFGAKDGEQGDDFSLIDREKLTKEAETMGKGVRFSNAKSISTSEQQGYIAYYSFDDINTLRINQSPSGKTPIAQEDDQQSQDEPLTFSFKRGKPATLVIRQPEKSLTSDSETDEAQESQPEESDTSGIEMMMSLMKGFRMSVAIEFNGTIAKTNATHVDGSRITLMEMDFEQLIRDRDKFIKLSGKQPQTVEETKQLLKDIPGIKIEMANETTVQFK